MLVNLSYIVRINSYLAFEEIRKSSFVLLPFGGKYYLTTENRLCRYVCVRTVRMYCMYVRTVYVNLVGKARLGLGKDLIRKILLQ